MERQSERVATRGVGGRRPSGLSCKLHLPTHLGLEGFGSCWHGQGDEGACDVRPETSSGVTSTLALTAGICDAMDVGR